MRILHIMTQKPFATGSGVYLTGILKELGHRHEQYLICGLNEPGERGLPAASATLRVDPVIFKSPALPFPVPGMSDVMPYESSLYRTLPDEAVNALLQAFLEKLEAALATFRPDAIICEHLYLLTAAVVRRLKASGSPYAEIPVLGICHGSEIRQFTSTPRWHEEIHCGIAGLDRIISTHAEQADTIASLYGLPHEKIRILGSGFDGRVFRADPAVRRQAPPYGIVFTGKLSRAKGVPELLCACDQLSRQLPIRLTLVGAGADPGEFKALEAQTRTRPYPVHLAGQLSQTDLARVYQANHLFVLPSYFEGMPLVVPEALACGMKALVTDLPGFSNWLAPFKDQVRLIPQPAMATIDEPTPAGRDRFIGDIARLAKELLTAPPGKADPALLAMTWQGLAQKLEDVLTELKNP